MKYRFKTKKEFIQEYGEDWRKRIRFGWNPRMNFLFGLPVEDAFANKILNSTSVVAANYIDGWAISKDMITEKKEEKKDMQMTISFKRLLDQEQDRKSTLDKVLESYRMGNPRQQKRTAKDVMNIIKNVEFDSKKKLTTVVLKTGAVGVSKCSEKDAYDTKVGFALAYMAAITGSKNQFQKLVEEYDGTAEKIRKERAYQKRLEHEMKIREFNRKQKAAEAKKKEAQKKEAEQFERDLAKFIEDYKAKKMEEAEKNAKAKAAAKAKRPATKKKATAKK